jgi:aspartate-semialdehyde dehydrogenase
MSREIMLYKIAVVGATGNVGREILEILAERRFPAREVVALASRKSVGKEVSFGDVDILTIKALEDYDFADTDIALFSPGSAVSKIHAPRAAAAGCVVIDNTSQFRMDPEIPLVIPEVNAEALKDFRRHNIIANPNCSTMQMLVALKPLHDAAKIKRIVVSTYQSVSGAGKEGMDELFDQTKALFMNSHKDPAKFSKRIAFNVIPHIDVFMDDGSTKEEWKMVNETHKILDPAIAVSATCVRVPVFVGHSESVNLEFERPISVEEAEELLGDAEGVVMYNEAKDGGYCTPIECAGEDGVYVSRLRKDTSVKNGLSMWIVSDNLRKGAALNAVQIAEELIANYGLAPKKAH